MNPSQFSLFVVVILFALGSTGSIGQWNVTAQMLEGRYFFETQVLDSHRVLIMGGASTNGTVTSTVEFYDARTKSCTQVAPMREARYAFASVRLPDGRIWICGGASNNKTNSTSIEVFNPQTNTWTSAGDMIHGRWQHSALLINDREILIVGGRNDKTECEIYDIPTRKTRLASSFPYINTFGKLVLTESGDVLAFSGRVSGPKSYRTDTIHGYEASTATWEPVGTMCKKMYYPTVTQLLDRSIYLTGGSYEESSSGGDFSTEIQRLNGRSFQCIGNLLFPRTGHSTIEYGPGRLLVIGGMDNSSVSYTSCEFVDVATGRSTSAPSLNQERRYFRSVLLYDEDALPVAVAIGGQQNNGATNTIEELSECNAGTKALNLSSDDVILVGSSIPASSGIQLTSSEKYQAGAVWIRDRLQVTSGFDVRFSFRITNGSDNGQVDGGPQGADGVVLVLQNETSAPIGKPGDGIGYNEIPHGLAVEFDSYQNAAFSDPSPSHIALQVGDGSVLRPWHVAPYLKGITSEGFPPFVADGTVYHARVMLEGGILNVYCGKTPVLETPVLTVANININDILRLREDGAAYLGFTSSTGFSAQTHELLSVQIEGCDGLISDVDDDQDLPMITSASVVPTPSSEVAKLILPSPLQRAVACTIVDLHGNVSSRFAIPAGSTAVNLQLQALSAGMYQVVIMDTRGAYTVPLVISR